ncbi:signal peptide peptidase SppA [Candidatus Woesearchaeota archaeon CG08_land_8_20_14_0_20_47_9]|nr:MAG: signal peptide peptidase SppA [Candidatus Woesearchaeota archaeon CG08_land_8_20_14_0_20_47_9]HII29897.1 signal peptide peptidase SppA [Candidatus Woesearchaeota archaeon]
MVRAKESEPTQPRNRLAIVIVVLVLLGVFSSVTALITGFFLSSESHESGNVALIRIEGAITSAEPSTFEKGLAYSDDIVSQIERADANTEIKAIILAINSPGGAPVASEEIARAVEQSNKTVVAWIRDIGTSGAYWAASSADIIVASPVSVTGSVGVIASYLEFSGLMEMYGVSYQRLVSGSFKDTGSPFRNMTPEEEELYNKQISLMRDHFLGSVAANRGLSLSDANKLADARAYTGAQAKELGLVDVLGGKKEAVEAIKQRLNITDVKIVEYKRRPSFTDLLSLASEVSSYSIGLGIGDSLMKESNGVSVRT